MRYLFLTILLIPILIGCTRVETPLGASNIATEKELVETVTKIGYYHYFKDGDEIYTIETTKADYDSLAVKGAGQPEYDDMKWFYSGGGVPTIATSIPEILDNEFFVISTTTDEYLLKEEGEKLKKVTKDYLIQKYEIISSNKLNSDGSFPIE